MTVVLSIAAFSYAVVFLPYFPARIYAALLYVVYYYGKYPAGLVAYSLHGVLAVAHRTMALSPAASIKGMPFSVYIAAPEST